MKLGVKTSSADFYGGGIYNQGAPSSLTSTSVSGNSAYDNGDIACLSAR